MNPNPYYIATYNGFLCIETPRDRHGQPGRQRLFTTANVREATSWPTFEQADAAALWGVNQLFPPDVNYFAIFQAPHWGPKAAGIPCATTVDKETT